MTVEEVTQFRKWSWDATKQLVSAQSGQEHSKAMVGFWLTPDALNIFWPKCWFVRCGQIPTKFRTLRGKINMDSRFSSTGFNQRDVRSLIPARLRAIEE